MELVRRTAAVLRLKCIWFLLFWQVFCLYSCHCDTVLYDLYSHLLDNYKPYVRPRVDPHVPVNVSVGYSMVSVENLAEDTQTLESSGYLDCAWTDDLLTWNSSEYSGITTLTLPLERIWSPDMVIYNSVDNLALISSQSGIVRVSDRGVVNWFQATRQRTRCAIDVTKFPFDTQPCSIRVIQWSTSMDEVNISGYGIRSDFQLFQANGEWDITGQSVETVIHRYEVSDQTELIFTFTLKRKYLYYLITNILPVMLLSVLNCGVFLLPPESGEKLSLCVSVVLSYAVFLTVISETLPEVSDTVSIFGVYLLTMLFLKVMTTLATVVILNVYHSQGENEKSHHFKRSKEEDGYGDRNCMTNDVTVKVSSWRKHTAETLAETLNRLCFGICVLSTIVITVVCFGLMLN